MTTELTMPTIIGIGGLTGEGEAEMVLFSNKSEMNYMHAYEYHNVNYYSHHFVFVSTFSIIKSK